VQDDSQPERSWRKFTRLRENRRKIRRSARKIESATLKHAHRFIIRRLDNVRDVKRHTLSWLALMFLLIGLTMVQFTLYQNTFSQVQAAPGGTYAEGTVGSLDTMNPLFAATSAERAASRLIFASLLSYDRQNSLRGELAETWTTPDDGKTYVVTMRKDLQWHDGAPLTVDDVMYTLSLIKNPQVNSSLYSTWADVAVQKINDRQISFTLPSTYAPFPHALTFGILPKHILRNTVPERLRESTFNRNPIGSGPFVFRTLQVIDSDASHLVAYMNANEKYVFGRPKLDRFQLHAYKDHAQLKNGFLTDEINAAADLTSEDLSSISKTDAAAKVSNVRLDNGVFALFRNDSPILKDKTVRQALQLATNRGDIIDSIGGYATTLEGPLTKDHVQTTDRQPKQNLDEAKRLLDSVGWRSIESSGGGIRQKDAQPLQLSLVAPQTGDYQTVVDELARQWRLLGVDVKIDLASPSTIQQNVLVPRSYDVLVYELAIGADPDVFAYWHSSQVGARGLNLSNYNSGVSDDVLSSARSRSDMALRDAKYITFTKQWLQDVPAVALYQPTIHYVSDNVVQSVTSNAVLSDSVGRYRAVEYWTVEQRRVNNTY